MANVFRTTEGAVRSSRLITRHARCMPIPAFTHSLPRCPEGATVAQRLIARAHCATQAQGVPQRTPRAVGTEMSKTAAGNFFEDFRVGQEIHHATPRTVTQGDAALYLALTGSRFGIHCSETLARMAGLPRPPLEDLLTFHLVFGRTVPDVSRNAVANLGYADCRFGALLYPGDSLHAVSEVIGLKESSSGTTGTVWVRTRGIKEDGRQLLEYVRWVLVRKRDPA